MSLEVKPQPGFQMNFLRSKADIVIGGGAAGAGKSFALLMAPLRNIHVKGYNAVFFRRTSPEITNAGGIWDESKGLYLRQEVNGRPLHHRHKWEFAAGSSISFSHMQYESDKEKHKSAQYTEIYFDELTTFTEDQFFYMLSRNRSATGLRPRMRATTNPQRSGWVKRFISWWLYPDDHPNPKLAGRPIPERACKIRYMIRVGGRLVWADTAQELYDQNVDFFENGDGIDPKKKMKSVTFIPGNVYENQALLSKDPGYVGNLMALPEEERAMLLEGSWKYSDDGDALYDPIAIDELFTNTWIHGGNRYITADIAFEGSDKYVIFIWEGLKVIAVEQYDKTSSAQVLAYLKRAAHRYHVPVHRICYDGDGAGIFLKGFLRNAVRFMNAGAPVKIEGQVLNYEHMKAQCAYKLAELIKEYKIHVDVTGKMQTELTEELLAVEKVIKLTARGKEVFTISDKATLKQKLGRSPDKFDALNMRMIWEIPHAIPGQVLVA